MTSLSLNTSFALYLLPVLLACHTSQPTPKGPGATLAGAAVTRVLLEAAGHGMRDREATAYLCTPWVRAGQPDTVVKASVNGESVMVTYRAADCDSATITSRGSAPTLALWFNEEQAGGAWWAEYTGLVQETRGPSECRQDTQKPLWPYDVGCGPFRQMWIVVVSDSGGQYRARFVEMRAD